MINVLLKLGYKVDEKDYIDLRKTSLDDEERDVIEKVLKYKSILVEKPNQFMMNKKMRKLFDVEEMEITAKKVLLVLIVTLTEMENIREFGGEEKVASILHLASLLYYSSVVKMERYNTDGVRNE